MTKDFHELFDLLVKIEQLLPADWPCELPPETTPGFWEAATRREFECRTGLSEKIRDALSGDLQSVTTWTPLEAWLYRRRVEWATQLVYEAVKQKLTCSDSPRDFLIEVIVDHWSDQGAIAFWNHAMERNGEPHPEVDETIRDLFRM